MLSASPEERTLCVYPTARKVSDCYRLLQSPILDQWRVMPFWNTSNTAPYATHMGSQTALDSWNALRASKQKRAL